MVISAPLKLLPPLSGADFIFNYLTDGILKMNQIKLVLFLLVLTIQIKAQTELYSSEKFKIFSNAVFEDSFKAIAETTFKIKSNYSDAFGDGFSRNIRFKFCINGEDNESLSGEDHSFLLNPVRGKQTAPLYKFGKSEKIDSGISSGSIFPLAFGEKFSVLFRVDMNSVFNDFNKQGYFITKTGAKILKNQFEFISIAGGTPPLYWGFGKENAEDRFKLTDIDGDGIYQLELEFEKTSTKKFENGFFIWEGKENKAYPQYSSGFELIDAVYNLSIQELEQDIRKDKAFMAGAKWTGVWTRDISYSIILSLAALNPENSRISLLAKVKNGIIIQDTGTGGSYPVSTDRMVWAIAAWEIYKATGDNNWLNEAFAIISKSAEADQYNIIDNKTGLVCGESSFLDWREQTYPKWMDPKDIFMSKTLGTNAVHYEVYNILSQMAERLKLNSEKYKQIAESIKIGINKYLWNESQNAYGQFLYGRQYMSLSKKTEALGSALCALFEIADAERGESIINNLPVTDFGVPCIFPQIPNIPNYHNNGIWSFVVAYYSWAAAKVENAEAVQHGLASIYRSASLFLTNKENMVASNGNCLGTEINSDRQLWSVAASLATVYRIFAGIEFEADGIRFSPFVPEAYKSRHKISNFKYRNSNLNIVIEGSGNEISEFLLDGKLMEEAFIPGDISGQHSIVIKLSNHLKSSKINFMENYFAPETPVVNIKNGKLFWGKIENVAGYRVYKNGKLFSEINENIFTPDYESKYLSEYQISAIDINGVESFLSEPMVLFSKGISKNYKISNIYQPLKLTKNSKINAEYTIEVANNGTYAIDFLYANGNGPLNTDNKCAVRTLIIDDSKAGVIVLPQRGTDLWDNWGYSNNIEFYLKKGKHIFEIQYDTLNENMNFKTNDAVIKNMRISLINGMKEK